MRIAVLVKQVPRPAEMLMVDGRLVRENVGLETNAYCRRANARAVELAGPDGEVVVFTMGPPSAELAVREMVACGATRGVVVSDRALAGSDTLITARVLTAAVAQEGPFDLIFGGAYSLDSETGHIGVQLAELLGLPFIGPCRTLDIIDGVAVATVEAEGGFVDVEALLPLVASAAERLCGPSKANPDQVAAVPAELISYRTAAELGLDADQVGLNASPTQVGSEIRDVAAGVRRRIKTTSIEEALGLLDSLAVAEQVEPSAADLPAQPVAEDSAAVWCVLDPTAEQVDESFLGAVIAIARRAGRHVVTFIGDSDVEDMATRVNHVVRFSGPDAPEDWVGPLAPRLTEARPHCVVIEATNWGREVGARLAARLGWGLVGDAVDLSIDGSDIVAWKSAFSGQAMVPITSSSPTLLVTVRPGTLGGSVASVGDGPADIEVFETTSISRVLYSPGRDIDPVGRELSNAQRLIVVGAGVPPEQYDLVEELRELIGAGPLAASRKVTDKGWLPRSRQIGITGRSVAPELLISIGANGGFNHAVSFSRATRILAINQDPDAPIFEQADVGIIGDWRDVVTRLRDALRARAGVG